MTPSQTLINNNKIYIYILVYIMETRGVKKGVKGGESRGRVVKKSWKMAPGLAGRVKRGYALQSGKWGFLGRGKKVKEKKVKFWPVGG